MTAYMKLRLVENDWIRIRETVRIHVWSTIVAENRRIPATIGRRVSDGWYGAYP